MRKHFIYKIISAMVVWGVYGPAAALSSEDNQSFLEMINEIRRAPYKYAMEHLECTHDFLTAKGISPDTTFDPYERDEDLIAMAADESEFMAGGEPPETKKPIHRLTASTGGVVSFFNFMSQETAFKVVIDYLFKNELDTKEFNHILSDMYAYAGIAISAGTVESGNAWFVAINLGSSARVSEIQMLNLINQVRFKPELNIWEYTDLNWDSIWKTDPENQTDISELLYSEYKPLFFDASLSASAQAHAGTDPEPLSETQTALERAAYYGYEGEVVQEFLEEVPPSTEENAQPVYSLFLSLIRNELEKWPLSPAVPVTFLNDFQDVGSNITFQSGDNLDVWVLSFVVGRKNAPNTGNDENTSISSEQCSKIYGILFSDENGNGLYDPGEELIQHTVKVYVDDGDQEIESVDTDNAGHFSTTLEANRQYNFIATIKDIQVSWEGNEDEEGNKTKTITSDQFVPLFYTPASEDDSLEAGLE